MKYPALLVAILVCVGGLTIRARAADEHEAHAAKPVTIKGEVVDLACYLGHGASGTKHAECAKTCMEAGLPVGLKAEDGKTYIVIGDHKPINDKLAPYAGKTITLKGKVTEKDGISLLSGAEIIQ